MSKPTVAVLGASADRSKYGNISLRAHLKNGYEVYPVNPKGGQIEGLPVYRSLAEVPVQRLNRITVYLPPEVVLGMLDEIAERGCDEFWLNPGADRNDVVVRAQELGLNTIVACSIIALGGE